MGSKGAPAITKGRRERVGTYFTWGPNPGTLGVTLQKTEPKLGTDKLRAELRLAHFCTATAHVCLVIAQFNTLCAQVQKRKLSLVGSFLVIVYIATS
jgi:hypothetical protein